MEVALPEFERLNEVLDWHNNFFVDHDDTRNPDTVVKLLQSYVEKMQSVVPTILQSEPMAAWKLTKNVTTILTIFHNRKEKHGVINTDEYFELMSDALAFYCDLQVHAYLTYMERVEDTSVKVVAVLKKFLDGDEVQMVNVILKMTHLKYGKSIFEMIFEFLEKKVSLKECRKSIYTYIRYILFYRQWKRMYNDVPKLKEITDRASQNIKEPPGFRTHALFNIIRPGPIIPLHLTKHLLTTRIDTVTVSKKFFQYVKDHPICNEARDVSDFIDLTFDPNSPEIKDEDTLQTSSPISTSNNRTNNELSVVENDHSRVSPPPIAIVLDPLNENRADSPTQIISSFDRQMVLNTNSTNEINRLDSITSPKKQDNYSVFNSWNKTCDSGTPLDHRNETPSMTWTGMQTKSIKNEMRAPDSVDTGISSDRSISESCSPPYASEIKEVSPFWAKPASTSTEPIVTKITPDNQSETNDVIVIPDSPQPPCGAIDDSANNTPSSTTHVTSTEPKEVTVGNDVNISSTERMHTDDIDLGCKKIILSTQCAENVNKVVEAPSSTLETPIIDSVNTPINDTSLHCDILEEEFNNIEKALENLNNDNNITSNTKRKNVLFAENLSEVINDHTPQETTKNTSRKIVFTSKKFESHELPSSTDTHTNNVLNIECATLLSPALNATNEDTHLDTDINTSSNDLSGFSGFSNISESQDGINPPPSPHNCSKHLKTITKSITEECSKIKSNEKSKQVTSEDLLRECNSVRTKSTQSHFNSKSILKLNEENEESGSSPIPASVPKPKRVVISNERGAKYQFKVDKMIEEKKKPITYDGKLKSTTGKEFNINTKVQTVQTASAITMEMSFDKMDEDRERASTTDNEAEGSPPGRRGRLLNRTQENTSTYRTRSRSRERSPGVYKSLNEVALSRRASLSKSPSRSNYRTRSRNNSECSNFDDGFPNRSETHMEEQNNGTNIVDSLNKTTKKRKRVSFGSTENISEENLINALRYKYSVENLPVVAVDRLSLPNNILYGLLRKKFNCEILPTILVEQQDLEKLKETNNKRMKIGNTTRSNQVTRSIRSEDYTNNSTETVTGKRKRNQAQKNKTSRQSEISDLWSVDPEESSYSVSQRASIMQYTLDANADPTSIKYVTSPYRVTTDTLENSMSQNENTFNKFINSFSEQPKQKTQKKVINKNNKQPITKMTSDMLFDQLKYNTNNTLQKLQARLDNKNERTLSNSNLPSTSRAYSDSKKLNSVGFRSKKPASCIYTNLDTTSSVDSSTSDETEGLIVSNEVTIEDNEASIPECHAVQIPSPRAENSTNEEESNSASDGHLADLSNVETTGELKSDIKKKIIDEILVDNLIVGLNDSLSKPDDSSKTDKSKNLSRSSSTTSLSSKSSSKTSKTRITQTKEAEDSSLVKNDSCSSLSNTKRIFSEEGSILRKTKKAEYVKSFRHVVSNDTFTIDPRASSVANIKNVASKPTSIVKPTVHKSPSKELFLEKEAELDLKYIEQKKKANLKKDKGKNQCNLSVVQNTNSSTNPKDNKDHKFKLRIKINENPVTNTKQDHLTHNNNNFKNAVDSSVISTPENISTSNNSPENSSALKTAVNSNGSSKTVESKKKTTKKTTKKELPFKKRGAIKPECDRDQVYDKSKYSLLTPMLSIADIEVNKQLNSVDLCQPMSSRQFRTPAELKEVVPIVQPMQSSPSTVPVVSTSEYNLTSDYYFKLKKCPNMKNV